MSEEERRRFSRISVQVDLTLAQRDSTIAIQGLRNISLGGAYVFTEEPLPGGTQCSAVISLVGPSSMLRIGVDAEVVRADKNGMAITFTHMDVDSLVHLRHLIKVHSMDPAGIDEEFSNHVLGIE